MVARLEYFVQRVCLVRSVDPIKADTAYPGPQIRVSHRTAVVVTRVRMECRDRRLHDTVFLVPLPGLVVMTMFTLIPAQCHPHCSLQRSTVYILRDSALSCLPTHIVLTFSRKLARRKIG